MFSSFPLTILDDFRNLHEETGRLNTEEVAKVNARGFLRVKGASRKRAALGSRRLYPERKLQIAEIA